jgi:hypothetical protein
MKKGLSAIFIVALVLFSNVPLSAQRAAGRDKIIKPEKVSIKYGIAEAFTDGNGVWIEWQTEAESNNLGFYVFRVSGDSTEQINKAVVLGGYMKGQPQTPGKYSYFDAQGNTDSVYYVRSLDINGRTVSSTMISPQTVEDLSVVAGASSESLKKASMTANPDSLQSESELPDDLQSDVNLNALQADAVTQRWVAAQPGVRIGITKEGFYRVSRAELQSAGFNVNASSALWQLYANGVEQAINIGAGGNYIEFYGRGIDTIDTDTQIYYLVVGTQNGKRIGTTTRRPIGGRVMSNSFSQSQTKKERIYYTSSVLNGDAENFFGTFILGTAATVTFNLPAVDFTVANASVDITLQGLTPLAHQTRVVLNGEDIGAVTGNLRTLVTRHYNLPTSFLRTGVNTLQLTSEASSSDISMFESVKVNYARKYQAEQNQLSFYTANYKASNLEGFSSPNIRVFDITYLDSPSLIGNLSIEQSNGAYRVYLPSNRGRVMYAVEDSAILQAASITQNTPSTLTTAAHNADLVIISHKDYMTQANDWATYRRAPGMTVEVVNIEDVFDEFNFGAVSSLSIRSFLQYAKNNWQTAPRYVFLIGDSTYDPRNYEGKGNFNFVPTKMVDTVYGESSSDDTLADFNDDGLAELAIGRSPARSSAEVALLLSKTQVFEQTSAQGFSRGVLFASDQPLGWDFQATSNRLRDLLPVGTPSIMINEADANSKTNLLSEMNIGRFFINYAGHGSGAAWTSRGFFNKTDAAVLTNGNKLSVYTMLSCFNGQFVQPSLVNEGLGEALLKAQNGGATAVWASTGETTPDVQEIMATRFYQQLSLGNIKRLGDLVNDSKTVISAGRDVRLSWVLLGDPTLKVR